MRQTLSAASEDRLQIDFSKHSHLGWTHYRILLYVEEGLKRGFYFQQAASHRWSKRELQRQIDRALFERVALSGDTRALVRLEKESDPVEMVRYEDAFKDPYLLDFLGLKGAYSEKDLEAAIIANLQQFLIEPGSDFCFIRLQFPMRIDDDDYYLDRRWLRYARTATPKTPTNKVGSSEPPPAAMTTSASRAARRPTSAGRIRGLAGSPGRP